MKKYYTRVCNFYYGNLSKRLVKQKKALPLNGNHKLSFDHIEILSRNFEKKIHIEEIKNLSKFLKKKINKDLNLIIKKKKNFCNFNYNHNPNLLGILNLTPDSFSDGGKFNKDHLGYKQALNLFNSGAQVIDIGGESTRPGSKEVKADIEWKRVKKIIKKLSKKITLSLDTRKSIIMEKGIKNGIKLINDISGLQQDKKTIDILKKYKIPFVIHHIQGKPETMQKNPKYKNVLLDIYDFFEKSINKNDNKKIILDPGIGFGKNLKHNLTLISKISLFHSLGFPILIGTSRKRFISQISGVNDSKERIGGTVASVLFLLSQGVQVFRVHSVNEVKQSILVFRKILSNFKN